ncbi:retrovirus-related Pol polyprotein from transposon TNT 1-94, partial [Trifolium pratense]
LLVDNLASIGDPIPLSQHIDVILEGLPSEFNSVISVVESQFESMDIDELEALLLAHENPLEKFKKKTPDDAASINIVQNPNPNPTNPYQTNEGRGGRNSRGRSGRSGGGRTNPNNENTQCQICFKPNHTTLDCWHRNQTQHQSQNASPFQGHSQAPPPGYFQEAYGPYSGQNFPPRFGQNYGYGTPTYNSWPFPNPPPRFPAPPHSQPSAMIATAPSSSTTPTWYPDSGASFHVTGDSRNIQDPSYYAGAEHIYMAVHLINRLPTASLNFSVPYTTLLHKNPEYNSLKVFGSACFPLLRPYSAHKFDFRSHECIFLGNSTTHKGYKCLSPSGRIFISKDVLFNESRFPYESLFSISNKALSPPIQDVPISTLPIGPQITNTNPDNSHTSTFHSNTTTSDTAHNTTPSSPIQFSKPTNTHPMQTRAKSGITLPKINPTLLLTHTEPRTVKQALQDPKWLSAMTEEFEALTRNQTWTLVPLPHNRNAIGCK